MLWNATGLMPNLDRVVRKLITDDIHFAIVVETWLHPERAIPKFVKIHRWYAPSTQSVTNEAKTASHFIIKPEPCPPPSP